VFNLQGSEIIIIMLLALVVLGPEKLPDAVRRFSKTYGELKKMGSGFQTELKSALDEPMREMRETAQMVRDAADPTKIADEAEAERRLNEESRVADPAVPNPAIPDPAVPDPPAPESGVLDPSIDTTPSFDGVSDPGSDSIGTPGGAPESERTPDDNLLDAPEAEPSS